MNTAKDKQILVTGGTGFLGSYLLRYLVQEGYTKVRAIRRANSQMDLVAEVADQIEWVETDILDIIGLEDAMRGVSQVYHCAAMVSFDNRDHDFMRKVNVEGTANVVNIALDANIEKLVYVSSIAAIGRTKENHIITEKTKWQRSPFNSPYGISKYLAEQEVWRGVAEGLNAAIVNPSVILGSGRWDEGPLKLFKMVWNQYPFYTTGTSSFVDVRDVSQFMIRLMESDISSERFILNAENLTIETMMKEIAKEFGKKPPFIKIDRFTQQIIWRVEWLRARIFGSKPLLTREVAQRAVSNYFYKNDKSLAAIDFKYTPIRQTIGETCGQFKKAVASDFQSMYLPLN